MGELLAANQVALDDLHALEAYSDGGIEILRVVPGATNNSILVELSISCAGFQYSPGGIKLRDRERFWILLNSHFPLSYPFVYAKDTRHAFSNHAYWIGIQGDIRLGTWLCLYYDEEHQWEPGQGIGGFVHRLMEWLERAAAGKLDQVGAPIHPPLITFGNTGDFFVIEADTPAFSNVWLGYAVMKKRNNCRYDVVGWRTEHTLSNNDVLAPAILIDTPFISEFPTDAKSLLFFIQRIGISFQELAELLMIHTRFTKGRPPIFLLLGVAMRGPVGGRRRQHIVAWRLEDRWANNLRNISRKVNLTKAHSIKRAIERGEVEVEQWRNSDAQIQFCRVYERRPEVTLRRDDSTSAAWFYGKSVLLFGAGALGSHIAEQLVRAKVNRLHIVDKDIVKPGVLVRQCYCDADIGKAKVDALTERLRTIDSAVIISGTSSNILTSQEQVFPLAQGADVLIDTTGSRRVAVVIDKALQEFRLPSIYIVTMCNDAMAERALMTITPKGNPCGPTDLIGRAFVTLASDKGGEDFLNAFWPNINEADWFEPEPGCSSPTFRGSAADAATLSGGMLAACAQRLQIPESLASVLLAKSFSASPPLDSKWLGFPLGTHLTCPLTGYEIRLSVDAQAAINDVLAQEQRGKKRMHETGGILFGYRDDYLRIMWVVDASGPPTDSLRKPATFICGTQGVLKAHKAWMERSREKVGFLGTWHSHPVSAADPSITDLRAISEILANSSSPQRQVLMAIVGYSASNPSINAFVYKHNFVRSDACS